MLKDIVLIRTGYLGVKWFNLPQVRVADFKIKEISLIFLLKLHASIYKVLIVLFLSGCTVKPWFL
jgi:hypothetical protein